MCDLITNYHAKLMRLQTMTQLSRKGKNPFMKCSFRTSLVSTTSSSTPKNLQTYRQFSREMARTKATIPMRPITPARAITTPKISPKTSLAQNRISNTSSLVNSSPILKAFFRRPSLLAIDLFQYYLTILRFDFSLCQIRDLTRGSLSLLVVDRKREIIIFDSFDLAESMKEDHLTINGIDKLIGGVNSVIVQFIMVSQKVKNGQKYYGCELNDGYCKLKGCLVVDEEVFTANKAIKEYMVAKVTRSMSQQNKSKEPIIIIESYLEITDQINEEIGNPISYEQFLKRGKKNPEGSNYFEIPPKKINPRSKYDDLIEQTRSEQEQSTYSRPAVKEKVENKKNNQIKPNNTKGNLRLSNEEESRITRDNSSNNTTRQTSLNFNKNNQNSNQVSNNGSRPKTKLSPPKNNQNRARGGPIQRVNDPMRASPSVRGNQNRPHSEYNEIKSLYVGMQNFVILGRILFVFPIKNFINKKGVESSLLNIQIGDKSGTIECTIFGETAQRFEGKFKEDQIYQIAQAQVVENTYMGHHSLKITFNEMTRVSMREDDPSVPLAEDFCVTIKQLMEMPVGEVARVICLVKDGQVRQFTSKAGKLLKTKQITLCDPIDKVEVVATIWDEKKLPQIWQRQPYMITGVLIKEYRESKQYQLKNNYATRVLKYHNLRKFISQIDSIEFSNPDSAKKKRSTLNNFKEINNLMDEIGPNGSWSEVICSFCSTKTTGKNIYMVCPHCNKKVLDEVQGQCPNCSKDYESAIPKYTMSFSLCDSFDSVWASAFDRPSEKILGIPASKYTKLSQEELQELVNSKKYEEFKLKMVTNNEEYNNEMRKKTKIIDILPLNYAAEAKNALQKLSYMMGS